MNARRVCWLLVLTLCILQIQLWSGSGSLTEVHHLRQAIQRQQQENHERAAQNAALAAEVEDLKQGLDVIEELARSELAITLKGETFYHIIEQEGGYQPPPPQSAVLPGP